MLNQETIHASETFEAVIIGGGVIGLGVARALARSGLRRVALVERGQVGMEASHAAAGMLAPQVEADRADAFFELASASRDLYPAFAAELLEETGIDIELERTGTLLLAFTAEDEAKALQRYDWQNRAGIAIERLTAAEAMELEPCISKGVLGALRFPRDWQVENRRLVAALTASARKAGVRLLTETHVDSINVERGRVVGVGTSKGALSAPLVVVASGAWSSLIRGGDKRALPLRIEPVRGQMLCFETAEERLARHVIFSPRGYIVPRLDKRLLAGSTTEHAGFDKRVTGEGRQVMMTQALEIAPSIASLPLAESWAGLRPRADDEQPVIGMSAETEGLCYATGHYRNGILLAPITAELIAEQVTGGSNGWSRWSAFSPDRFHPAGVN